MSSTSKAVVKCNKSSNTFGSCGYYHKHINDCKFYSSWYQDLEPQKTSPGLIIFDHCVLHANIKYKSKFQSHAIRIYCDYPVWHVIFTSPRITMVLLQLSLPRDILIYQNGFCTTPQPITNAKKKSSKAPFMLNLCPFFSPDAVSS